MGRPENVHRTHISRFRHLCRPSGQNGHTISFPNFLLIFRDYSRPFHCNTLPLGPNVNSWNALGASREPTFLLNATCVGTMGRMGIPLASPIFYGFSETIHNSISALPCPIRPNVNRWAVMKTSTELTFPVFMTCVGPVGRMGIPLAYPIFCVFFETIHDNFSAIPCHLGPNLNCWDALGASREPTFQVFVTCVGTMGRLVITLASSIFCGFLRPFTTLSVQYPAP